MTTPKKQRMYRKRVQRDHDALTIEDLSPESRRQLEDSIREMERGEQPVPLRDILRDLREGRTA